MPKLSLGEVERQLRVVHGVTVRIVPETYVSLTSVATFIDNEFGPWQARPYQVTAGRRHPNRCRRWSATPESDFVRRLAEVHGTAVSLSPGTYVSQNKPARFVDVVYGEWTALAGNVLKGQRHPSGKQQRTAKTMASYGEVLRWSDGAACHPASSYERVVLLWLNHNRYDFEWQVPFETPVLTPTGKRSTYYVDLRIDSGSLAGTFVEIKGSWHNAGTRKQKWDWFHSVHSNSELWTKQRLTGLGIAKPGPRGTLVPAWEEKALQ